MGNTITALLVALTALSWLVSVAVAPGAGPVATAAIAAPYFLTALTGARIAQTLLMHLMAARERSDAASDLVRVMTSILLYGAALMLWLRFALGFDIGGLLATSAIISLVLGLALQTTLGNVFAGLSLEIERPFHVGDYIRVGDAEGRVEALKWRSVFLRTPSDTMVILPNNSITSRSIEVFRRGAATRMSVTFHAPASIPPVSVLTVAREAMRRAPSQVEAEPAPNVVFLGAEKNGEILSYAVNFHSSAAAEREDVTSRVLMRLWYALSREGVEMRALDRLDGSARAHGAARAPDPSVLGPAFASIGERLPFGPEEIIPSGLTGFVIQGAAREALLEDEVDVEASVAALLAQPPAPDAPLLIPDDVLATIAARAVRFIGPIAHALADRCARLTADPYLVYRVLAHGMVEDDRVAFLASAPAQPSRLLAPGAPFGWAAMLGVEPPTRRPRAANWTVQVLSVDRRELKALLDANDADFLAGLIAEEPGLKSFDRAALSDRLRQAAGRSGKVLS